MKNKMIFIRSKALLFTSSLLLSLSAFTQTNNSKDTLLAVKDKLKNKAFTFIAQSALPLSGRNLQLNGIYDLIIKNDSIYSNLPYFGRAFTAPMSPGDAGYIFSAPIKSYELINRNKKGYDIVIVPNDRNKGEKYMLTAFDNGSANLRISSTNRQPISFNGYVK